MLLYIGSICIGILMSIFGCSFITDQGFNIKNFLLLCLFIIIWIIVYKGIQ